MKFPQSKLEEIRKHLEEEKAKIEVTLLSLKSQDPYSDPERLNDNAASDTEAKEESSHERVEALEKELKLHLSEIEQAIDRLTNGRYGKCSNCRRMIDTERLAIKPTALLCLECEKKKEK